MPRSEQLQRIIDRMNVIGAMSETERLTLRAACTARGYHVPTGERIMTATPQDCCFDCGFTYIETPEAARQRNAKKGKA